MDWIIRLRQISTGRAALWRINRGPFWLLG
jgi:hypothetical protein